MKDRVSPTFVTAGVVIGLSCFVLLSMLFYGIDDYYGNPEEVAASSGGGFRFSVASMFFRSLGLGAFVGWAIILSWAVIVFFKESVGNLALRGASLVVVVVSAASFTSLVGAEQHAGSLGLAVGTLFQSALGPTLASILMLGIFGTSLVFATDRGFVSYLTEAKTVLAAEAELSEPEVEPVDEARDLATRMTQVAEEELAVETEEPEEPEPETPAVQVLSRGEDRPLVLKFHSPIEEERLDEELLVAEKEESGELLALEDALAAALGPDEAEAVEETPEAVVEATEPEAPEPEAVALEEDFPLATEAGPLVEADAFAEGIEEPEATVVEAPVPEAPVVEAPAPEAPVVEAPVVEAPPEEKPAETGPSVRDVMDDLDSVFDALVGPSLEEPAVEEPVETAQPTEEPEAEPANPHAAALERAEAEARESVPEGTVLLDDEFVLMDEVIIPAEPEVEEAPVREEAVRPVAAERVEIEATEEEAQEIPEDQLSLADRELPDGAALEDEDSLLPFMLEDTEIETGEPAVVVEEPEPVAEISEPEPVAPEPEPVAEEPEIEPVAVESEAVEELPVLEDVEAKPKPAGLRALFRRKASRTARDPLVEDAGRLVIELSRASVVLLQRRLDIGYTRASRLIEALEREGLVGPLLESGSREVLLTLPEWESHLAEGV